MIIFFNTEPLMVIVAPLNEGWTGVDRAVSYEEDARTSTPCRTAGQLDGWTAKETAFTVTSGKVTLGVWADSPADKWLTIDNVSIRPAC
ncbi:hypothetical protein ABZY19_33745 [Streptomyces sp. NPDC006475]|uniref:hypothetical protein n=1 Tax=Streptomyces sp. NPDC006475 TaxID=3155719 RepID=UPI0033B705B7